jgi:hypothetical protein
MKQTVTVCKIYVGEKIGTFETKLIYTCLFTRVGVHVPTLDSGRC